MSTTYINDNYLAIEFLERLGNKAPTEAQIQFMEELIGATHTAREITFNEALTIDETCCLYWLAKSKNVAEIADITNQTTKEVATLVCSVKAKLTCQSLPKFKFGSRFHLRNNSVTHAVIQ